MVKIVSTLLLSALLLPSVNAEQETQGLKISLISEKQTITPGSTMHVGLHILHEAGFHTYWKNPGVVGMATAIEWQLPSGFQASEIQWPYPKITSMAGHPCHGYERDVVLLVKITAPKKIQTKSVTLTAKTRWMCCAKNCYPGFRDFTLTLPVSDKPITNPKISTLIASAKKELPKRNPPWIIELLSKPDTSIITIKFTPKNDGPPAPEYLFSEDGQISSDQKQLFVRHPDGSYTLKIQRSEFSPKNKTSLPAVLKSGKNHHFISPTYR